MFEIKIRKTKPIWPFMLAGLMIMVFIVYVLNNRKKEGLMEKPKGINESNSNKPPDMTKPITNELFFLSDLSAFKLAKSSSDVRGWEVRDAENHLIGTVDDLLVNKEKKAAVYLDLAVDVSIIEKGKLPGPNYHIAEARNDQNRPGDDHLFIPVEWVVQDGKNNILITYQISYQAFIKARRFSRSARTLPAYPIDQFRTKI